MIVTCRAVPATDLADLAAALPEPPDLFYVWEDGTVSTVALPGVGVVRPGNPPPATD